MNIKLCLHRPSVIAERHFYVSHASGRSPPKDWLGYTTLKIFFSDILRFTSLFSWHAVDLFYTVFYERVILNVQRYITNLQFLIFERMILDIQELFSISKKYIRDIQDIIVCHILFVGN